MPLEDICALPVKEIAAKDSALFLWATAPLLREAFQVIEAWGFRYSTMAFVWVKGRRDETLFTGKGFEFHDQIGNGYWSRSQSEFVLLGVRGSPKRVSRSVRQVIFAPRTKHSAKPPEVRDRIVELMGDLPRLEMFARKAASGWDAIGDGITNRDIREDLASLGA